MYVRGRGLNTCGWRTCIRPAIGQFEMHLSGVTASRFQLERAVAAAAGEDSSCAGVPATMRDLEVAVERSIATSAALAEALQLPRPDASTDKASDSANTTARTQQDASNLQDATPSDEHRPDEAHTALVSHAAAVGVVMGHIKKRCGTDILKVRRTHHDVVEMIAQVLSAKVASDAADDSNNIVRERLSTFLATFMDRQYGLKQLASTNRRVMTRAAAALAPLSALCRVFAWLTGETDESLSRDGGTGTSTPTASLSAVSTMTPAVALVTRRAAGAKSSLTPELATDFVLQCLVELADLVGEQGLAHLRLAGAGAGAGVTPTSRRSGTPQTSPSPPPLQLSATGRSDNATVAQVASMLRAEGGELVITPQLAKPLVWRVFKPSERSHAWRKV